MTTLQKHYLSTADKVRAALGWTLFVLSLPVLFVVALAILGQIFILSVFLLHWLLSSIL